jgi:hypothetical protein
LRAKKREEHHLWRGCGELDGQFYGFIKCHAKRRGISFDLSITFLWELFLRQGRMCALTGLPITFETLNSRKHGAIQTASLDRKDSSRGYVQDNVQWVHKDVNYMKNDYTMDRFLEVCRLVVERYGQSTSTPARTTA